MKILNRNQILFYFFAMIFVSYVSLGYTDNIPPQISYQGKLAENNMPVNGEKSFIFSLMNEQSELWTEPHENVLMKNGIYHVILGAVNPIPLAVFEDQPKVKLKIMVDQVELLPHVDILSVGYAFVAQKAVIADRLSGNTLFVNQTMNVGIGTNDPKQRLDVSGGIHFGYTNNDVPGSIRTDGEDIEFYNGDNWLSLLSSHKTNSVQITAGEDINGSNQPVAVCISKDGVIISQTIKTASANAYGMTKIGASFKTDSGTTEINSISLYLEKYNNPTGVIDISVYKLENNNPLQMPVKSMQLEINRINNGWNFIDFTTSLEVEQSQQYAIVLWVPGGNQDNYVKWFFADSNPYPDGLLLIQSGYNSSWEIDDSKDLMLKIYCDNRVFKCDEHSEFLGISNSQEVAGHAINFQTSGVVNGYTDLHKGMSYYIQEDGSISTNIGDGKHVGIAISDSELLMKNESMWARDSKGIHSINDGNIGIGVKDAKAKVQITNLDDTQDALVVQQKVSGKNFYRMQTISIDQKQSYASDIHPTQNGFLIGGIAYISKGTLLMIEMDNEGNLLWHKNFVNEQFNFRRETYLVTKTGEIIVAGLAMSDQTVNKRIFLVKFDKNGNFIWGKLTAAKNNGVDMDVFLSNDGNITIVGGADGNIFVYKITQNGDFLEEKLYKTSYRLSYYCSTLSTDDSIIVVSNYERQILLLRFDKNFEVKQKTIVYMLCPVKIQSVADGYIILGQTGSQDQTELVKVNKNFEFQWGKHINHHRALDFCITPDNDIIILCFTQQLSMIKLNQENNIQWIRNYGENMHIETIRTHTNGIILGGFYYSSGEHNKIMVINTDFNGIIENCQVCNFNSVLQEGIILDFHPNIKPFSEKLVMSPITPTSEDFVVMSPMTPTSEDFLVKQSYDLKYTNNKMWDGIKKVLIVSKSGKVGIGTETPDHDLQVNGTISSIASYETSDIRYKKELTPIENPLQTIEQITGYRYHWRADEYPEMNFQQTRQIGFIAPEIEKVYPELVFTDNKGISHVDYDKVPAILVECIKDLKKLIEKQQEIIENQQVQINKMNLKIGSMP